MAKRGKVKQSKTRNTEERAIRWRKYPHLFLVVCEDENTEPYYFGKFKEKFDEIPYETLFLRSVGTGRSSKGVVEKAIEEKQKLYDESNKTADEVWAVFDKDDAETSAGNTRRFNEAFEVAEKSNVKIAYSNEAFELWLLLHFTDIDAGRPMSRQDIYANLEEAINRGRTHATQFKYKHGETEVIDIALKSGDASRAMERANSLNTEHDTKGTQPINANPNTKVNLLIKRLRELLDWYTTE